MRECVAWKILIVVGAVIGAAAGIWGLFTVLMLLCIWWTHKYK